MAATEQELLMASLAADTRPQEDPRRSTEIEIRAAIERYAKAWRDGDRSALADCYHEDFTLHYFGDNVLSGDHVGKAAALKTLAEFSRRTNRQLKAVVATMAGPERGALVVRELLGTGSERVEVERLLVYAVRDRRFSECWVYDGDRALFDRLIGKS
jgi:uncharacterized protein